MTEPKCGAACSDATSGGTEAALTPGLSEAIEMLEGYADSHEGITDEARAVRVVLNALSDVNRDAERYRWLRSEEVNTSPIFYPFWSEFHVKLCREEAMDALIDSAMTSRVKAGTRNAQ